MAFSGDGAGRTSIGSWHKDALSDTDSTGPHGADGATTHVSDDGSMSNAFRPGGEEGYTGLRSDREGSSKASSEGRVKGAKADPRDEAVALDLALSRADDPRAVQDMAKVFSGAHSSAEWGNADKARLAREAAARLCKGWLHDATIEPPVNVQFDVQHRLLRALDSVAMGRLAMIRKFISADVWERDFGAAYRILESTRDDQPMTGRRRALFAVIFSTILAGLAKANAHTAAAAVSAQAKKAFSYN